MKYNTFICLYPFYKTISKHENAVNLFHSTLKKLLTEQKYIALMHDEIHFS